MITNEIRAPPIPAQNPTVPMAENLGLEVFNNPEFGSVRVVSRDGEPWFVAADVCKALELSDVSMSVRKLDDDEKGTSSICTLGGEQKMTIVNEPGLYGLVIGSRKPEAKAFKRWITHDVIPAIRKTGGYIAGEEHQKGNIMPKNLSPPAVHHQGRPKHSLQYQASMLKDAAAHVRLSPSAAALLVYYGTQAERFHPSLKLIERKTGISANKVSEKRKELVDHGLIFYVPGIMVAIRWEVIRIFALMLP